MLFLLAAAIFISNAAIDKYVIFGSCDDSSGDVLFTGSVNGLMLSKYSENWVFKEYVVGGNYGYAMGVNSGDIDNNGFVDVVSSDAGGNRVKIYLNYGHKLSCIEARFFGRTTWPEAVLIRDMDNDGLKDIVVAHASQLDGKIVYLKNPGMPQMEVGLWRGLLWEIKSISGRYLRANDIDVGDVNNDGYLDVVSSSYHMNTFDLFTQSQLEGGGWRHINIDSGLPETRMSKLADFDKDGMLDFIGTSRQGNRLSLYRNVTIYNEIKFSMSVIDDAVSLPMYGDVVDINGDGNLDIAIATGLNSRSGELFVYWGQDGGVSFVRELISDLPFGYQVKAGDIDNDGRVDLVATSWEKEGGIFLFKNTTSGWVKHALSDRWGYANSIDLLDINSDGCLDILASADGTVNEVKLLINIGCNGK